MKITTNWDWDDPVFVQAIIQYLPDVGAVTQHNMTKQLVSFINFWQKPLADLLPLLPQKAHPAFIDLYRHKKASQLGRLYQEHQQLLLTLGVKRVVLGDSAYPSQLMQIHAPPPILYLRGNIEALSLPQLAVVGSRKMSPSGAENAFQFARYLASVGMGITSGLAQGVDGRAHLGALSAGGITVAVMATGIDQIYPSRHKTLAEEIIASGGCLVSEFKPTSKPIANHFPRRNRVVSGLSLGVLVVEAALRSGSLITARLALEQNREVFAIPGSIHNPMSRGCHSLIKQGATLVETAEDIAEQFQGWQQTNHSPEKTDVQAVLTKAEQQLFEVIGYDPVSIENLSARTQYPIDELLACLTSLQLKMLVYEFNGRYLRL